MKLPISLLMLILFVTNAASQPVAIDSENSSFKLRKDPVLLSKNVFVLPRPNALAVGFSYKTKHKKLALGPWVEYFKAVNNTNGIDVSSQSLGFLANYTFSKNEAYGSGPTVLFISSIDRYEATTDLGSKLNLNDILLGLYGGYQYTSPIRLNIWLGVGVLAMVPFNATEEVVANETVDAIDNFDLLKKNRLFPFPGIMIGYAF
jgi:hypothetical protein